MDHWLGTGNNVFVVYLTDIGSVVASVFSELLSYIMIK